MKTKKINEDDIEKRLHQGIIGKFFHTLDDDGTIRCQGQILTCVINDTYLVEHYSWWDGCPNGQVMIDVDKMSNWIFYDTNQEMLDAYEKKHGHEKPLSAREVQATQKPEDIF